MAKRKTRRSVARVLGEDAARRKAGPLDPMDPLFRGEMIRLLRRGFTTASVLSEKLHTPEQSIIEAIAHLEASGYMVLWSGPRVRISRGIPAPAGLCLKDHTPLLGGEKVFGVLSDTHLCSHHERLDVLEAAYDAFAKEGIKTAYHCGNIVDGHTNFNRFELYCHGITDQALYCLDHYPQRSGLVTHFITGQCHEGWWFQREGIDIGNYLMMEAKRRGRDDLHYLGFGEADIELVGPNGKSCIMRLMHPGGGTAYALSYATQKIIESLQGGEKPSVMLVGHYHKFLYHMVRNVHCIQAGCCQDQTPWMRKKHLEAHVGFSIVRVRQDAKGVVRQFSPTFTNYFDRTYHVAMKA